MELTPDQWQEIREHPDAEHAVTDPATNKQYVVKVTQKPTILCGKIADDEEMAAWVRASGKARAMLLRGEE